MRIFTLLILSLFCIVTNAQDDYPNRQIRIVVPYSAGGPGDLLARIVGERLHERWGQTVLVENRAGASGNIGAAFVSKSPADGYTLMMAPVGVMVVNPLLNPNLPYEPLRDFSPITLITKSPFLLAIARSLPVKTVNEFITYARANPGKLFMGNAGTGTGQHLAGVYFANMTATKIMHVPYKGSKEATNDLLANVISAQFDMVPLIPLLKSEKLIFLGVSSQKRLAYFPDIRTIAELTGINDYEYEAWNGIVAPAGVSPAIIFKLQKEISAAISTPEVRERLQSQGLEPVGNSSAEFTSIIKADISKYKRLIELGNVKAE